MSKQRSRGILRAAGVGALVDGVGQKMPELGLGVFEIPVHIGNTLESATVAAIATYLSYRTRYENGKPINNEGRAFAVGVGAVVLLNVFAESRWGSNIIEATGLANGPVVADPMDAGYGIVAGATSAAYIIDRQQQQQSPTRVNYV